MKVGDLIAQLKRDYTPEQELVVGYWDKEWFEAQLGVPTITDEQYDDIVGASEDVIENTSVGNYLAEAARAILEDAIADDCADG